MTDLSDFGVDISEPETDDNESEPGEDETTAKRTYRNGRCPAISTGSRRRCRAPVSRMNAANGLCGVHGRENNPWTIHDDPETLILLTGRIDALTLDEVDPGDVDFDLDRIQEALAAVQGDA